ncbi:uncharacterized protein LOC124268668 [Haliotis rubra]|uniref:uncharacterized protein LOC124268668 n=1 Tax=Haliotis rubra TaxID=36100 RepID=UPI001EE4F618|nr:uncharacterized protein LOC124268668 [Haliotis rubra]
MFTVLFGLLALSCLPLSVLGAPEDADARMYRVDITLPPKEGRDEKADILEIKTTLAGLTDIKVLFSFKELGNSVVILVLRVDKACSWPQLTSFLARRGYEVKVTPVYYCSDFAQELGLNMTRDFYDTSLEDDEDLIIGKQIFPVKDLTTTQYDDMLKEMFEREMSILNGGQRSACFRTLASLPVELIHFAPVGQKKMEAIAETMNAPGHFDLEILRIQKLDQYTGGCE